MTRLLTAAALAAGLLVPAVPASACIQGLCDPVLVCVKYDEWSRPICV